MQDGLPFDIGITMIGQEVVRLDEQEALLTVKSGSGSSNTTKTASTDDSSRHSNVSTAPSSADFTGQDEGRNTSRKPTSDPSRPPSMPKSASSGSFLKAAGRTFSFGGQKKNLPPVPPSDDDFIPPVPSPEQAIAAGRARATTSSTSTTVTPPTIESSFNLDLGGDFSKMLGFDKRASVMTVRDDPNGRQASAPRSLTASRSNQPTPIQVDQGQKVEPPPHSWSSHHSNDGLLTSSPLHASPTQENAPPPLPSQATPTRRPTRPSTGTELKRTSAVYGRRSSVAEDVETEDARLLKDSLSAVSRFIAESGGADSHSTPGRWRKTDEENLFDNSLAHSHRAANRAPPRKTMPTRNKVMTPAEFERYRRDKERQDSAASAEPSAAKSDDEDNYEDDDDDVEKAKQQAKQRRKQEAHMTVYRQQMMKVTGEAASNLHQSRPSLQISFSTPDLPNMAMAGPGSVANPSDDSDSDEEVPLAILAAHGFPNKTRAPTRLSTMGSNPNLRASQQPSYQRPGSAAGDAAGARGSRLPAFARNLPQDPFLGAGLVNNPVRESFALGGGAPAAAPQQSGPLPPGGLVGVIASEERSRAMRRGSPHIDNHNPMPPPGQGAFDPLGGIPPNMMYQNRPASTLLNPADPAQQIQINQQMNQQMNQQVNQQMQQLIQMQMQFMQMMTGQGGNGQQRPNSTFISPSSSYGDMGGMPGMQGMQGMPGMTTPGQPDMMRQSFMGDGSVLDLPRGDAHMRTMSMVQPSSSSWIQPMGNQGYAPSIRIQGTPYAPSIAPSERSNIGLPGRYRPVSQAPPPAGQLPRSSTMSGALGGWNEKQQQQPTVTTVRKSGSSSDDEDEEEGWQAMKAKREKKRSLWKSKKGISAEISALIT